MFVVSIYWKLPRCAQIIFGSGKSKATSSTIKGATCLTRHPLIIIDPKWIRMGIPNFWALL
jgi:hypothetical protein